MSPFASYFPKTDPLLRRLADPAYRALQDEAFRALARGYEATFAKRGIEWPGLLRLIDLAVPEKAGADVGPHGLLGEDGDLIMARHRLIDPLITVGSRPVPMPSPGRPDWPITRPPPAIHPSLDKWPRPRRRPGKWAWIEDDPPFAMEELRQERAAEPPAIARSAMAGVIPLPTRDRAGFNDAPDEALPDGTAPFHPAAPTPPISVHDLPEQYDGLLGKHGDWLLSLFPRPGARPAMESQRLVAFDPAAPFEAQDRPRVRTLEYPPERDGPPAEFAPEGLGYGGMRPRDQLLEARTPAGDGGIELAKPARDADGRYPPAPVAAAADTGMNYADRDIRARTETLPLSPEQRAQTEQGTALDPSHRIDVPPPILNPVPGGVLRSDKEGWGTYGAPRTDEQGKPREKPHLGYDVLATPGSSVVSPIDGKVVHRGYVYSDPDTRKFDPRFHTIHIEGTGRHAGMYVKLFYVDHGEVRQGQPVREGNPLGAAQNPALKHGPDMQPHVHTEVRWRGKLIDPVNVIKDLPLDPRGQPGARARSVR